MSIIFPNIILASNRSRNMNSTTMKNIFFLLFCILNFSFLIGCGGDGVTQHPTVPAKGTASIKGASLANCQLSFVPVNGGRHIALGETDAQGNFVLSTYATDDGAVVGEYSVGVTAKQVFKKDNPYELEKPSVKIPEQYTTANNSPLKISIPEAGNEAIKIEIP